MYGREEKKCEHEFKKGKSESMVFCIKCGQNWHSDYVISKPHITIIEYRDATKCPGCGGTDDGKLYPSDNGGPEKRCKNCSNFWTA